MRPGRHADRVEGANHGFRVAEVMAQLHRDIAETVEQNVIGKTPLMRTIEFDGRTMHLVGGDMPDPETLRYVELG